ncbi:MAG: DUF4430 domain-containing protein [Lachnospiraceae bacterium]|nr:DUF4430 domain-containing protein [Lachnospiraceae bacterium]
MQWNKKWLAICVIAFVAVAGVLIGKGMKKQPTLVTKFASETEFVTPVSEAPFTEKTEEKESGKKENKSEHHNKEEKREKSSSPERTTMPEKKGKTSAGEQEKNHSTKGKKTTQGKKTSKNKGKATPSPTREPAITPKPARKNQVTIQIHCLAIMNQRDRWKKGTEEIIPPSGIFYSGTCEIKDGDTAYDVLKTVCEKYNIALDSQYTPLYETRYIRGIGNLYEFDCGDESGWKYSVNGLTPGVGCSGYRVKTGDTIVFFYDCQL